MEVREFQDYETLSRTTADLIIRAVKERPAIRLGLATGSTPLGVYRRMAEDHGRNGTSYAQAATFNLDEYIGLPATHANSYHRYMELHLFRHLDIPASQVHIPNGRASDIGAECRLYEERIAAAGGIDLQLLGLGANGHIGFNEPGTSWHSGVHVANLSDTTRAANARFFPSLREVPKQAITMGIRTILQSRQIVLMVSGSAKSAAYARLTSGIVSEDFPASVLNLHPNVLVMADQSALDDKSSGFPLKALDDRRQVELR